MAEEVKAASPEEEHVNELKELCQTAVVGQAVPAHRRRWWQRPKRQLQARLRRRAVTFYHLRQKQGSTLLEVADRLRLRPRTLRQWAYACREPSRPAALVGRPRARSEYRQRRDVIELLKVEGPGVGVPALRECFPGMARAELTGLLERYRRVLHDRYQDTIRVCHWCGLGRIWAMDFAEPSEWGADESLPPIEGGYPYLLAVRDLASGYQLAWLPVRDATADTVRTVLACLFARHGAPLVLKSDNGSSFRADEIKAFLERTGVTPLYSPPHWPAYNGAIEAGIGSLKWRTQQQAARQGRVGIWTWDDIEAARQEANALPVTQCWTSRTGVTDIDRVRWQLAVQRRRMEARLEEQIGLEDDLDHWHQSVVDRKAIDRALVEHGYLLYSRRRIPLRLRSQKVTNIT